MDENIAISACTVPSSMPIRWLTDCCTSVQNNERVNTAAPKLHVKLYQKLLHVNYFVLNRATRPNNHYGRLNWMGWMDGSASSSILSFGLFHSLCFALSILFLLLIIPVGFLQEIYRVISHWKSIPTHFRQSKNPATHDVFSDPQQTIITALWIQPNALQLWKYALWPIPTFDTLQILCY